MANARSRPASTASSLMQDVPGAFPERATVDEESNYISLSRALHSRRSEYVRPKHVRIKIGSWNVAAYKGTEKDVGGWFVQGKGVTEALAGLTVADQGQLHGARDQPVQSGFDEREDVATQEARYARKKPTLPKNDPGSLPGDDDIGLYVLGLQEVVDIGSFTEALRPYTDPSVGNKWKDAMADVLPKDYLLVAEQQLIGMLLLVYASSDVANDVRSVSTTSVGTGIAGYMGNKGAVTARIVLGETSRLVFINSHLSAGADKIALERRNWDAAQVVSRTRFEPIKDSMGLQQTTGEQIGDEDFAFWCGDLNYRLEGIPGDDVRRLLMLHTRNEYDLSQRSARKIEKELQSATESVKRRVEERLSIESNSSSALTSPTVSTRSDARTSIESARSTVPSTLIDEVAASDDPTSLQATLSSLLPHDELHQQMKLRRAFHDGWQEGPISFLPTYKYDAGSVGVFDSSEKKRAPSWCDRILYRSRRDRLTYEAKIQDENIARKKDEEMKALGTDQAGNDEEILYDYDPETDGDNANDDYDEYDEDAPDGVVVTKEGFEDEIELQYYTAHQRVLSSDHKPLDAVFMLKYDAVVPDLKAKVHAEVAKELDKAENEGRPAITVVVDAHRPSDTDASDEDPSNFEGVWFGDVRWGQAKHRTLTIANTGRVPASFILIERPVPVTQASGVAPSWLNIKINDTAIPSSSHGTQAISLEPGETNTIELELRIFDMHFVHQLNEGQQELDDILVLRVDGGRDHFIPIRGHWLETSLSRSIDRLTRIPEGGIRKLQRQTPDSSKSKRSSGSSSRPLSSVASPADELPPVRFSTPRELFALTEAVEDLVARVVAEFEMMHSPATSADEHLVAGDVQAPWVRHAAWPFDESCWVERDTALFQDSLSAACNALDCDQPLVVSLPPELPRIQQLYVLAALLMLFLKNIDDGIVTVELWQKIDSYLADVEKTKRKQPVDEERMAIQEVLAQDPSHSISFVLVTSMVERVIQEISGGSRKPEDKPTQRPRAGTLRRMTALGKVPTVPAAEEKSTALAKVFAEAVIRLPQNGNEKARAVQDRRRLAVLEIFFRKYEPG